MIVIGITIGGGLYEARVVMPLWSAAAPDSVTAFYQHNSANPQFAPDPGGRFWIFVTPFATLLALAILISAFWTAPEHRKWRIAAGCIALIVDVATFAWFVPTIIQLSSNAVMTMSRDELASLTNWWVNLNWVRAALLTAAWLAALRAMTIPTSARQQALNPAAHAIELRAPVRQTG